MVCLFMDKSWGYFVSVFLVVFMAASVSAIPQTINVHGKLSNATGVLEGTYSLNFSIYDSSTGGTYSYNKVMDVTSDSSGVYSAILTEVDLNFSSQYYLGIAVESDDEMTPRVNLTSSPYAYMAQNISAGGIIFDGNVDMGTQNITTTGTGFFGWIGSFLNRVSKLWVDEINATGNIVTVGNVSADYFIGDGSLLTGVDGMTYTNLALTNQSNTFAVGQNITGDLNVTGSGLVDVINSSSSGNVTITSVGGSVVIKLG